MTAMVQFYYKKTEHCLYELAALIMNHPDGRRRFGHKTALDDLCEEYNLSYETVRKILYR